MAVVARRTYTFFLVDISAHVLRIHVCDVFFHDEKRRYGLHVARQHDGWLRIP